MINKDHNGVHAIIFTIHALFPIYILCLLTILIDVDKFLDQLLKGNSWYQLIYHIVFLNWVIIG